MKKLILSLCVWMGVAIMPAVASASGWHYHGNHHPPVKEVVKYYPRPYREVIRYYPRPRPVVTYVPRPVVTYVPRPRVYYAPPPPPPVYYGRPQYNGYAPPGTAGLAGGVIGGVVGYGLGNGDPLATGIGAAAGAYFGNEIGR